MPDKDFLLWIYERLHFVYGENELYDYMHKLRAIIADMPPEQNTPNDGRGGSDYKNLLKLIKKDDKENTVSVPTGVVLDN